MGLLAMSIRTLRASLGTLAAVALAAFSSHAIAVIWGSDYDPPPPFPVFIGTASFEVADVCLSTDGRHVQANFGGCSIQVLTNVSTTPAINFNPILNVPLCSLCKYEVIGGKLVGINTGVLGSVVVGTTNYWFEFLSTFVPGGIEIPPHVINFVNLYDNCFDGCAPPINQATIVTFAVAAVPEPGPLGLIVGALGAGWLVRRRKAH